MASLIDLQSLMTSDAEHLFMCLLDIYVYLWKCLFKPFDHFLIGLLVFWLSFRDSFIL